MDLKSLVTENDNTPSPEYKQNRVPSINDLVNPSSSSGIQSNGVSEGVSMTQTRPSIVSITNVNDIDINGNQTPSLARKISSQSQEKILSDDEGEDNEHHSRKQPTLADMLEAEDYEIDEPTYEDKNEEEQVSQKSKTSFVENKLERSEEEQDISDLKRLAPESTDNISDIEELPPSKKQNTSTSTTEIHKPKKYDTPPIFAQKWIPKTSKLRRNQATIPGNATLNASQKDPSVSSLGGLYSIKGTRPYNDIARRISQWIFVNIKNTHPDDRGFLELEIKLGRIIDRKTTKRIIIPVVSECVLDENFSAQSKFESELDEHDWIKLKKYISDMMVLDQKKFRSTKSDTKDQQFREVYPGQLPRNYRVSSDLKTSRIMEVIEKKRIASLFIHCPDLAYDFRLSLSLESPQNKGIEKKFADKSPQSERIKKRLSVDHELTNTKFDITEVIQKEKGGKESKKFEFELEVHMKVLLAAYNAVVENEDNNMPFQEVPDILMDNARILNRYLSKY